jgi:hypothetical protein
MRRWLALLALVLLALWLALGRGRPGSTPEAFARIAEPASAPAALLESAPAPGAAPTERTQLTPPAAQAQPAGEALAELRGRLVLEDGAPAVGAALSLQGAIGNSERALKYGKPADWKNPSTQSDADGRFVLLFDPPRAYQFSLEASHPGCVRARWRWSEIERGATKDLGETVLPRGGAVAGRVLDARGRPTGEAWSISADARAITQGVGSDSSRAGAQADPATG